MVPARARRYPRGVPDILIATDSASVYNSLRSVLDAPGTTLRWVRAGQDVRIELDRQGVAPRRQCDR